MKNFTLLLSLFLLTACLSKSTSAEDEAIPTLESIESMIADKSCSGPQHCKVIGIGARPCGGPEKYVVYSDQHVDVVALLKSIKVFNASQKNENVKNQRVGICVMANQPATTCSVNQCVAVDKSVL